MKIFRFIFAILALSIAVACNKAPAAPGGNVKYFQGTFDEALQQADSLHKPLFIYGYTSWCPYCKKMDRNTLSNTEVVNELNNNYICLSYDLEKDAGVDIKNKFGLDMFPVSIFLNNKGDVIAKQFGNIQPSEFLQLTKNNK